MLRYLCRSTPEDIAARMNVTLLIPTLNELEGLKVIMPRVEKIFSGQILFVDGGSTDGTLKFLADGGYQYIVQKKLGLQNGLREAMSSVTGDVVITFSPDNNSIPELIPDLIKKMEEGYDMVIVSRYKDGAISEDDDLLTAFGNWFFTKTINLLFGSTYTDAMVMYRAFKADLPHRLGLDRQESYGLEERLFHTRISWDPLMSVRCAKQKFMVGEIAGDEPRRTGGKRKLQIVKWGCAYYFSIWKEYIRR